jgi:hypothetical protein
MTDRCTSRLRNLQRRAQSQSARCFRQTARHGWSILLRRYPAAWRHGPPEKPPLQCLAAFSRRSPFRPDPHGASASKQSQSLGSYSATCNSGNRRPRHSSRCCLMRAGARFSSCMIRDHLASTISAILIFRRQHSGQAIARLRYLTRGFFSMATRFAGNTAIPKSNGRLTLGERIAFAAV